MKDEWYTEFTTSVEYFDYDDYLGEMDSEFDEEDEDIDFEDY